MYVLGSIFADFTFSTLLFESACQLLDHKIETIPFPVRPLTFFYGKRLAGLALSIPFTNSPVTVQVEF